MCIIVFKPKRVPMPTLELMTNCFEANPDGAGFMYRHDGKIHISKGYMTLEELLNAINLTNASVNLKKTDVVIHFRITTHGSSIPMNCHPFPLSNSTKDLKALNFICDRAIAHNGILHEYGEYHNPATDMSDTMYFAKMLAGVNDRFLEPVIKSHSDNGSGRFVLMSGKGKTVSFGLFKVKGCGLYYSNTSYIPRPKHVQTLSQFSFGGARLSSDVHWMGNVGTYDDMLISKEEAWKEWVENNKERVVAKQLLIEEPVRKAGELMVEDEADVMDRMHRSKWDRRVAPKYNIIDSRDKFFEDSDDADAGAC